MKSAPNMEHTIAEPTVKTVRSHWSIKVERDADELEPVALAVERVMPDVLYTEVELVVTIGNVFRLRRLMS
jgi:hypothetical protein